MDDWPFILLYNFISVARRVYIEGKYSQVRLELNVSGMLSL